MLLLGKRLRPLDVRPDNQTATPCETAGSTAPKINRFVRGMARWWLPAVLGQRALEKARSSTRAFIQPYVARATTSRSAVLGL